jgi:hypothetical protein
VSQALLFVALHLVGVAFALAFGPRERPLLCCAVGFGVGLAIGVFVALVLELLQVFGAGAWIAAMVPIAGAFAVIAARRGVPARTAILVAAWTAGFALVAALLTANNVVIASYDSHRLVLISRVIVDDGGMTELSLPRLHAWGVFQVVAQTLSVATKQDFLYGLPIVSGVAFAPVFALTLWAALGAVAPRLRVAAVALATVALFSVPMVGYHVVYLHTNFASAIYLFTFVVLWWLAETSGEPSYLPVAFVSLAAFALQRTENPLVAIVFLALTVAQGEGPRRAITPWLAGFVIVVAGWYAVLAENVAADGDFLSPARCRTISGLLVATFAWWILSARAPIRRLNAWLPHVLVGVTVLGLAAAFASKPGHMGATVLALLQNVHGGVPYWGVTWHALALLAALALVFPAPSRRVPFVIGVPVFLGLAVLMAYSGPGYRVGTGDSGNRMIINAVPLAVWYLALKAAGSGPPRSRGPASGTS